MQFASIHGVTLHHQLISASAGKPTLVFSNSLGTDLRIWRDVIVRLAGDFGILCYDKRGHGLSDLGKTPYSLDDHVADLAGLLDLHGVGKALICGLSVGGMIAQGLQASRPDLVGGLILCDTAHKIGSHESWNARIRAVEAGGMEAIADTVLKGWFTPAFRHTEAFAGYRNMLCRQPEAGYIATCEAIRDADLTETARWIEAPTICIVGEADTSTPPALVADLARMSPRARFEMVSDAAHMVPVEQPGVLSEIIRAFATLNAAGGSADARQPH